MKKLLNRIGLWLCKTGQHGKREIVGGWGINTYARCKRCGYEGMIDSQGNLF